MDLMHAEPVITRSVWAIGFLGYVLVLGGLPLASIGLALPLVFVGTAVGGGFALRAWRELMATVRVEASPSIVR